MATRNQSTSSAMTMIAGRDYCAADWFTLDGGARNLLDRNAGPTGFLGDGVVLLLNGSPSWLIAVEPA
jgi:hypothetical protein